jgi:hypothetical protein
MKKLEYECAMCHKWCVDSMEGYEEAQKEYERDYPTVPKEQCIRVCDDCYQDFKKWEAREMRN